MKKIFLFLIAVFLSLTGVAQKKVLNPKFEEMLDTLLVHNVNEVYPEDVALEKGIFYLDSRKKKEFDVSHIEGARWIGYASFSLKKVKDIPKDEKIVVYWHRQRV